MPNSDYGFPDDLLRRDHAHAEMLLRYPEGAVRSPAEYPAPVPLDSMTGARGHATRRAAQSALAGGDDAGPTD